MTRLFAARPYIIAEVGSNWRTLEDCLESILAAKSAGADAVKFQAFNFAALYGLYNALDAGAETVLAISKCRLELDWLPKLKEKADECDIEFMCTAFSPDLVKAVDPFVSVHKVASSDAAWPQMLEAVGDTGKPVILSTGAKTAVEVKQALEVLDGARSVVLLYCVAAYPAVFADLDRMELLDVLYDKPFGFSDHTLGITAAVEASRRGATVIEKHFTAFPDLDTPDRPHSITSDDFKLMVDVIRDHHAAEVVASPEERDMLLRHNRRLIATRDIAEGETLTYGENFGAYRSLKDDVYGMSPFDWMSVEGRKAAQAIRRGDGIGYRDFV
jgi:N,N'-diacetyllegionaminate synthase